MTVGQEAHAPAGGFRLWAVAGGKGGVGKSTIACNLALALAERDLEVVLADANLGGAGLHTLLGIQTPEASLSDLLSGQANSLEEVLLSTLHPRVKLLASTGGVLGLTEPGPRERALLARELMRLEADVILLDLGPGKSQATLDLWSMAGKPVLVTSPEPSAVQGTYSFLQLALQWCIQQASAPFPAAAARLSGPNGLLAAPRALPTSVLLEEIGKLDAEAGRAVQRAVASLKPRLVVNMADATEAARTAGALAGVACTFLGLDLLWQGHIPDDAELRRSVKRMQPFLPGRSETCGTSAMLRAIARTLLRDGRIEPEPAASRRAGPEAPSPPQRRAGTPFPARRASTAAYSSVDRDATVPVPGMLETRAEDLRIGNRLLHIQTEDLGWPAAEVLTVIYEQGRILKTRRSTYDAAGSPGPSAAEVMARVRRQHEQVRGELLAGSARSGGPGGVEEGSR